MNRLDAIAIIKTIGKHAIDAGITSTSDIVDACAEAVKALLHDPDTERVDVAPGFDSIRPEGKAHD